MNTEFMVKVDAINEELSKDGMIFRAIYNPIWKNGGMKDGIILQSTLSMSAPTLYPQDWWWDLPVNEQVERLVIFFENHADDMQDLDVKNLLSKETIRKTVLPRLVNAENSADLSKSNIPFVPVMSDLLVIFTLPIPGKPASARLTESVLNAADVTIEEAYQWALKNLENQYNIRPLSEILGYSIDTSMLILSVEGGQNGAAAVLCEKALKDLYDRFGEDFIILPSSIHEVIVVAKSSVRNDFEGMRDMVMTINETEVDPEDKLSDNVYLYSDGKIEAVF